MTRTERGPGFDGDALLWLGLALLPLLCIAFVLPLSPHDYWWYLRLGHDTLAAGAVPRVDTFSYTRAGEPFVYQSWLSAVIFWLVNSSGGVPFTFVLRGVVIAVAYGLLWRLTRQAGASARLATVVTFAAGLAGSNNWGVRPQLLAYPLFLATFVLLREWQAGSSRHLWLLVPLGVLWTNLHGSFALLFVLGGAALAFGMGERRTLAMWMGLALLGTLLNPQGIGAWRYVFTSLTVPSNQSFSAEWFPPANRGWQMHLFFAWLLAFAPLAALSPRRLSRLDWVWFLGFGWLALSGLRYVIWFLFVLASSSAHLLSDWQPRWLDPPARRPGPVVGGVLTAFLLLSPLALVPGFWPWGPDARSAMSTDTPVVATDWLAAHRELRGQLWSELGFSSYLIYALPSRPVWIDTRFELYPVDQWERYRRISAASTGWREILDQDSVGIVMASTTLQPYLTEALERSDGWCERHRDPTAVIFVRLGDEEPCNR